MRSLFLTFYEVLSDFIYVNCLNYHCPSPSWFLHWGLVFMSSFGPYPHIKVDVLYVGDVFIILFLENNFCKSQQRQNIHDNIIGYGGNSSTAHMWSFEA